MLNNPLSYTDPDGYFFKKLFGNGVLRSLLSTAISIWLPGAGILIDAVGQWGAVFVSGFAAGVAANGSLRGGVMGAFSSGLFHSIGSAFAACKRCVGSALGSQLNAASLAAKSTLHGIAGGVMNVLQGGKFGHGFASASVTQLASGAIGRIDAGSGRSFNRVAVAAVLGGTVSEVTGGKFANGAIVGAFSRAFNEELHGDLEEREYDAFVKDARKELRRVRKLFAEGTYEEVLEEFPIIGRMTRSDWELFGRFKYGKQIAGLTVKFNSRGFTEYVESVGRVTAEEALGYRLLRGARSLWEIFDPPIQPDVKALVLCGEECQVVPTWPAE